MITVHLPVMLPVHTTPVDIPREQQIAALVSLGLLYTGSGSAYIAGILLKEIDCSHTSESELVRDREAYALSAGFALGLVSLGLGEECPNLGDLSISKKLHQYMSGAHRTNSGFNSSTKLIDEHHVLDEVPKSSGQILEGDKFNVEVVGPASMMALALIYLKTNNTSVASWLDTPSTLLFLEKIKPQHLLMRVLTHSLVMWHQVQPDQQWVTSNLPEIFTKFIPSEDKVEEFLLKCEHHYSTNQQPLEYDETTIIQSYVAIIAGACLSIGFRFAGSQHKGAFETVYKYTISMLNFNKEKCKVAEVIGKRLYETCFSACLLGLTMVVAGSGNKKALQLCRHVHHNTCSTVSYGMQMAAHMAIGFLFLGQCRYTLSTSNIAIAGLLMSVYPCFPGKPQDNRYHLQALRHMYSLACDKRLLVPIDESTGRPTYCKLNLHFQPSPTHQVFGLKFNVVAPCLIPHLHLLQSITVDDERHCTIHCDVTTQSNKLMSFMEDGMYVQRKHNKNSYIKQPKNFSTYDSKSQNNNKDLVSFLLNSVCKKNGEKRNDDFINSLSIVKSLQIKSTLQPVVLSLLQICDNDVMTATEMKQIILLQSYSKFHSLPSSNINKLSSILAQKLDTFFTNFDSREKGDMTKSAEEISKEISHAVYKKFTFNSQHFTLELENLKLDDVVVPDELMQSLINI